MIQINKLPNSEVELVGEVAHTELESNRAAAVAKLNQEVKVDGFRPGHIPEEVLARQIGEERILLAMAELALQKSYPEVLRQEKIDAIGQPQITITKLARGNPLGFKIRTAVLPELALPDYQALAAKIERPDLTKLAVTETEIDEIIAEIKKQKPQEIGPEQRDLIKQNLLADKQRQTQEKVRLQIMDGLIAATVIALPPVLIETELDKMESEWRGQLTHMGLKFEDYLKHLKKERADLRQDWRGEAEKRLKTALLLAKIAEKEKLTADPEMVKKEVAHLHEHYKDLPAERLEHYVRERLLVEQVWQFLEKTV